MLDIVDLYDYVDRKGIIILEERAQNGVNYQMDRVVNINEQMDVEVLLIDRLKKDNRYDIVKQIQWMEW